MRNLIFTLLLLSFYAGSVLAQTRWQNQATIGQVLQAVKISDKDTLTISFNASGTGSLWAPAKATVNLGKDSVVIRKYSTARGFQVKGFVNAVTTTAYENGNFKCNNAGGNGNPVRVASIDSLKSILAKSVVTGTINGHANDSVSRPAACLFDISDTDQAFGMYPGKVKRLEYLFRFDYTGKLCTDDLSFEMFTYDAGNTGKTAVYEMAVYKSSTFSEANQVGATVANVYTSGAAKKTVNIAAEIGVAPSELSNKQLYIVVKTLGTSNASGVVDGESHAVDGSNIPVAMDPVVVFDNFAAYYASASWTYPAGVIANAIWNHNNNAPVVTVSTDWTGGNPVEVPAGVDSPVKLYFTSIDRVGGLQIKEANDGGVHAAAYSFAETGAIKQKDGSGSYTIDVPYVRTINATSGVYTLDVAAPASGSVNNDLEVTVLANVPLDATRSVRLELTNGVRFWYNVAAKGIQEVGTSVDQTSAAKFAYVQGRSIVSEAGALQIFNLSGQLVKSANAAAANAGVSVEPGIYIVKSGAEVQKVVVR